MSVTFVQWEPSCYVRTDRHDEGKSDFSQLCEKHPTEQKGTGGEDRNLCNRNVHSSTAMAGEQIRM